MKVLIIRKTVVVFASFLLASVLLTACGSNADKQNGNSGANGQADLKEQSAVQKEETAPSAKPEQDAGVRQYTDANGREVEVPDHPQRIIAHYYAAEVVALEGPLVGTNFINAELVVPEKQLQGVEDIGQEVAPNLEKVLSLHPDLIIVPNFLESNDVEELSKIAPTVVVDYSSGTFDHLRALGEIIGKSEQAEAWIKAYTAKAAEKRSQLQSVIAPGETASAFVLYQDKQLYLYGPKRLGPTMYDALGFTIPPKVEALFKDDPGALWKAISLETFPEYAGDRIFLVSESGDEAAKKELEEVKNGTIWKNIPAVKNGKAYIVGDRWAFNDPLTLDWLLDEMTDVLLK